MRFSTIFLLGCGLVSGAAQAQTFKGIGVRVGGNLASGTFTTVDNAAAPGLDYSYRRSALAGYQVGVGATFGSGHWALQPSLVFSQKGLKQTITVKGSDAGYDYHLDEIYSARIHYLELPVNLVYGFGADGAGFQLYAGPYVAVGMGGQSRYSMEATTTDPNSSGPYSESGTVAMAFGDTFSDEPTGGSSVSDFEARARRIDAGLNFGVGYRRGPLQVQLGYGLGLLNAQPKYPASYDMPNDTGYLRTAQLTATYYFPVSGK